MANITYSTDFLNSNLRWNILYNLIVTLTREITELDFRNRINELNIRFISPRVAFSATRSPQMLEIFYSTSDKYPQISQRDIVDAITTIFSYYTAEVVYEDSGEVPGGKPIVSPKYDPTRMFSLDWWGELYNSFKNTVSQTTGLPKWSISWLLVGTAILVIITVSKRTVVKISRR